MTRKRTKFTALARLLLVSLPIWAHHGAAVSATTYVPLEFRTVSGIRPFVTVQINGKPFQFMVHSNAAFYSMTTHANADQAGILIGDSTRKYGISAMGQVSKLGRGEAAADVLKVGDDERRGAPISVFELPADNVQGMLGLKWLKDRKVIVDYDKTRLGLPHSPQESDDEDRRLLSEGWVAHKMTWNAESGTYVVFGEIGKSRLRLVVSTVSTNVLDQQSALATAIPVGPKVDTDGGPTGGVIDVRLTKVPLSMTIDGIAVAPMQMEVRDMAGYDQAPNDGPARLDGELGCDFMLANLAVIDFGTSMLFTKPYDGGSKR